MVNDATSRDKIIEGAIKVFAQFGYDKASTALIAQTAGLSKSLLFHYFEGKADLYLTTYREVIEIIFDRLVARIEYRETDLLRRLRQSIQLKMVLMKDYPDIFDFLMVAYYDQPPDLKAPMQKINEEMLDKSFGKVYENIDYSLFRSDIDIQLALSTITSTLEKWSASYMQEHRDEHSDTFDSAAALSHLDPYLDFFRKCFYKEAVT